MRASLEFSERKDMFEMFSNIDLLAQICGQKSAEVLMSRYGSLTEVAKASLDELKTIDGVGERKAWAIKSAFTLASRMSREVLNESPLLDTPERIAGLLREENRLYQVERFQLVLVNTRRRLIRVEPIAVGTLDTVVIHPREVFYPALVSRASAVVLMHNHPSGDPSPSEADIKMTRDLIRAGNLLKIEVLDHIIIGTQTPERPKGFVSLREMGYFYS